MTAKKKIRERQPSLYAPPPSSGIADTLLRRAVDCLREPSRWDCRRWGLPTTQGIADRFKVGRAIMLDWLSGRRRAPAWFIAVVISELERQAAHRLALIAELKLMPTGDRRRSPEARARARALRMRQLGRPLNEGEALLGPGIDASTGSHPHTPEPK